MSADLPPATKMARSACWRRVGRNLIESFENGQPQGVDCAGIRPGFQSKDSSNILCEGTSNLRDACWAIGGYKAPLEAKRVYRSARLDHLSERGRQQFADLDIHAVIDLRTQSETSASFPFYSAEHINLPIHSNVTSEIQQYKDRGEALTVDAALHIMESSYRTYAIDHSQVIAEVLHRILHRGERSILVHCAAGKDRTGVVVALLLTALGASPAAIMEDYLLSNRLFTARIPKPPEEPEEIYTAFRTLRPSFLEAAFLAMVELYGGVDAYLHKALDFGPVERRALRATFPWCTFDG